MCWLQKGELSIATMVFENRRLRRRVLEVWFFLHARDSESLKSVLLRHHSADNLPGELVKMQLLIGRSGVGPGLCISNLEWQATQTLLLSSDSLESLGLFKIPVPGPSNRPIKSN